MTKNWVKFEPKSVLNCSNYSEDILAKFFYSIINFYIQGQHQSEYNDYLFIHFHFTTCLHFYFLRQSYQWIVITVYCFLYQSAATDSRYSKKVGIVRKKVGIGRKNIGIGRKKVGIGRKKVSIGWKKVGIGRKKEMKCRESQLLWKANMQTTMSSQNTQLTND